MIIGTVYKMTNKRTIKSRVRLDGSFCQMVVWITSLFPKKSKTSFTNYSDEILNLTYDIDCNLFTEFYGKQNDYFVWKGSDYVNVNKIKYLPKFLKDVVITFEIESPEVIKEERIVDNVNEVMF